MKAFEYTLKYAFLVGVSVYAAIFLGPFLIKKTFLTKEESSKTVELQSLKIEFLNEHTTAYITLKMKFDDILYKEIFYLAENKHKSLESFLCSKNFILNGNTPCFINSNSLPIDLNQTQISSISTSQIILNERQKIIYLKFDEDIIIGKSNGLFKKIFSMVLGIVFIVLGCGLFFIGSVAIYMNLKIYKNTGSLPHLSNTIDDMTRGIKFLFGKKIK